MWLLLAMSEICMVEEAGPGLVALLQRRLLQQSVVQVEAGVLPVLLHILKVLFHQLMRDFPPETEEVVTTTLHLLIFQV
jgi:hypothetical protein